MRPSVIFGINDFAQLLYYHLAHSRGYRAPVAFVVDRAYLTHDALDGIPVIPTDEITVHYPPEEYGVYICVGYNSMNRVRQGIYQRIQSEGYEILSFIHPEAYVGAQRLGVGNLIFQQAVVDAYTSVGDGNVFYAGSMLAHHSTMGSFNFLSVKACITGNVQVGNGCFFGAHSTVRNNIVVENHTLVGANAYVDRNTERGSVWVPARSMALDEKTSLGML